jgi:hypothetical protein
MKIVLTKPLSLSLIFTRLDIWVFSYQNMRLGVTINLMKTRSFDYFILSIISSSCLGLEFIDARTYTRKVEQNLTFDKLMIQHIRASHAVDRTLIKSIVTFEIPVCWSKGGSLISRKGGATFEKGHTRRAKLRVFPRKI